MQIGMMSTDEDDPAKTVSRESASATDHAWARPAVTFRLSALRRTLLRSLPSDSATLLSPTAAIENAIELAARAAKNVGEEERQFDALAVEFANLASQADRRAAEQEAALAGIERCMRDISDNVAVLVAAGCREGSKVDEERTSMRIWLDQEARTLSKRAFLAKGRWQSTSRIDDKRVAIELLVERIAAAELKGVAARGIPAMVRLPPLERNSKFARCDSMEDFYILVDCRPGQGWRISLHAILENSRPGPAIDSMSA